jgi:hypothetical protein
MKCIYCGVEYSDKIIDIHMKDCQKSEQSEDEIRQLAKAKGIKSWHVKSIETLKEELGV